MNPDPETVEVYQGVPDFDGPQATEDGTQDDMVDPDE